MTQAHYYQFHPKKELPIRIKRVFIIFGKKENL